MTDKMILDVTCGDRTIWFQKNEPHTIYCDVRREEWEGDFGKTLRADGKKKHRHLVIDPDIQCSFTDLPFKDNIFSLVVFDPPHIENLSENAWMRKSYGSLDGDWKPMIRKGFEECMRVLRTGGVLIFKWSDISVSTREIINVIGQEPLFGHRSGKKMNTHWMAYMKFDMIADRKTEPQTDGYMTAEQAEDYRKMLDKAEHKVYGNIEGEPQRGCDADCNEDCTECAKEWQDWKDQMWTEAVETEPQACDTCKWGEWYRKGYDITMMSDECGGCCSWNNKWTPKDEPQTDICLYCEHYEPKGYCKLKERSVSPNYKCDEYLEIKPYKVEIISKSHKRVYGAKAIVEDEQTERSE